ncbi:MAG: glycosyltransferase family 39 protein [Eubacteriales bacterium]|nr:glycosyltransferase family 39 protein [Eubacteriales bacterium]
MEKISRILTAAMLAIFGMLLGLTLLLGGCQPEHLSYCVAFALSVAVVGAYTLLQRRPRPAVTIWERLGSRGTAFLLLSVCFAVHLAWVLVFRLEPRMDYGIFWSIAQNLARGEEITERLQAALFPHFLGYSTFLSVFLRLFGESDLVAPILNVIFTTLSGLLLYHLTLRWRGQNAAALALLIWTLLPSKFFYNAMVLPDPWYTCLLLAALCLAEWVEARRPKTLAAAVAGLMAGLLLGLVQAARPIVAAALNLGLLLWVLLLRRERGREEGRRWSAFLLPLLAAVLLTGALWYSGAAQTLGEDPALVPGYSIFIGLNPDSLGADSGEDRAILRELSEEEGASAVSVQKQLLQKARERLHSGTIPFGKLFVNKMRIFLGCDEGGAFHSRAGLRDRAYQILALYSNIWYYSIGMLAFWGAWRLFRDGERRTVLLAPLFVTGLSLTQLLTEVAARYHYAVLPMLILLAAFSYTRPVKADPVLPAEPEKGADHA